MASEKSVKISFAFGYFGTDFHGSQIQPKGVKTVQGEIQRVINSMKWTSNSPAKILISSRTDSNVNARMNVGLVEIPERIWNGVKERGFLNAINDQLFRSIIIWSAKEVSDEWNVRKAHLRTYRYRMNALKEWPSEIEIDTFSSILRIFEGEHDFTEFCRLDGDRSPIREVNSCIPWTQINKNGTLEIIGFEITSRSFLWNQVRRIAYSILKMYNKELDPEKVKISLSGNKQEIKIGSLDARWLTLWRLKFKDIEYENSNQQSNYYLEKCPIPCDERIERIWQIGADNEQKSILYQEWIKELASKIL